MPEEHFAQDGPLLPQNFCILLPADAAAVIAGAAGLSPSQSEGDPMPHRDNPLHHRETAAIYPTGGLSVTGYAITYFFAGIAGWVAVIQLFGQQVPPPYPYAVPPGVYIGLAAVIAALSPSVTQIVVNYITQHYAHKTAVLNHDARIAKLELENRDLKSRTEKTETQVTEAAAKTVTTEAKVEAVVEALRRDGTFESARKESSDEILKVTPPTILIVEDSPETAAQLSKLFTYYGFSTTYAANLDAALAELDRRPDWVILDLKLTDGELTPETDGLEILRRIEAVNLPTRAAILTGTADPERIGAARALGADEIFIKPLRDFRLLIDALSRPFSPKGAGDAP